MKIDYEILRERIWLKSRRVIDKPGYKGHKFGLMWKTLKWYLIDKSADLPYRWNSEPTRRESLEYRIYQELINLCTINGATS